MVYSSSRVHSYHPPTRYLVFCSLKNSNISCSEGKKKIRVKIRNEIIRRWHGYSEIDPARFAGGMGKLDWSLVSAQLVMSFTKVRGWSGLLGSVRE